MIRAYRFLLRPTARQRVAPGEIRAFDPERHGRWSFSSQQATPRRLDRAFQAFLRRVKAGQTPGYPRFKGVGHFDTVVFPRDGDGRRWDSTPHNRQTRVRLQGVGHIRVHQHRPVKGRVKTISVRREGGRWYVVLACDQVPAEELPLTGTVVGIDMGVAHFLTTSEGEHIANPRFLGTTTEEPAQAQRQLAAFPKRARRRTQRHRVVARRVAKPHAKVRRKRLDFHHRTARALIVGNDVIAHERLNTAGMVRAPRARPDPDNAGGFRFGPARGRVMDGRGGRVMDCGGRCVADERHGAAGSSIEPSVR